MTQLEINLAEVQRDAGILLSSLHAESVEPGFTAAAYRLLSDYARQHAEFNSMDFRQHLVLIGFPVEVPKALGAVFLKAARQKVIVKIGYDPHPERHGSPTPRWQSRVKAAA